MDRLEEVIFIGLPGPTHHYGGLSADNVASSSNRGSISSPKEAALQVLGLMRLLLSLGITVGVLPPQLRPHLPLLRQHFEGEDEEVIRQAAAQAQALLEKASSASAMWTANAATVSPCGDTKDGTLHITAANLFSNLHRRIEAEDTYSVLAAIFADVPNTVVHPPLSAAAGLYDEGAANHMRLSPGHEGKGLHVFVFGANGSPRDPESARQSLSASKAVALQHHLPEECTLFVRQNADVIREGVFHNDVIAVSNGHVLLAHELAFDRGMTALQDIDEAYSRLHPGQELVVLVVSDDELSVDEAVHSYFFNSQIVTLPSGRMALIAPVEAQALYEGRAASLMERICADEANPIDEVHFIDLRQSMRNGGGPACLRLRVPMTAQQVEALATSVRVLVDEPLLEALEEAIYRYYPESLTAEDLGNPAVYHASLDVMEAFAEILHLPIANT